MRSDPFSNDSLIFNRKPEHDDRQKAAEHEYSEAYDRVEKEYEADIELAEAKRDSALDAANAAYERAILGP